jgi:hypothetical protein
MSEYDLIFAWSEATSHLTNLMQFWVSITFAILMVAHFASERLNLFLVCVLIALYSVFSTFFFGVFMADGSLINSIFSDAAALVESQGENASQTLISLSRYNFFGGETGSYALIVVSPLTYLCTVGYLIHNYKLSKRNHDANSE